ncbi:MAG: hypothetical protein WCJ86_00535 [Candidatus Saccharibacteria bacterium]
MTDVWIAALAAIGIGTWVFQKVIRRTGGNMKTTLIASIFIGVIVFFVSWSLLHLFLAQ